MGAIFRTPQTFGNGQSLFIATASYEKVTPGYAYALALTTAELVRNHIPFEICILEENCHVDDGRNTLVRNFLEGNCTDLLFIDADIMWSAKDVIRILAHKDELVCGAYPKKCTPHTYPIGRIFNTDPVNGLLEVSYAPTGFMRIRRSVFEKLMPTQSKHGKQRPTAVFFERKFNDKTRDGGDVTFCRKWIQYGGKVIVDPTMIFTHIGSNRWTGKFIDYLANDKNRAKHFEESKDPLIDQPRVYKTISREGNVSEWVDKLRGGDSSLDIFEKIAACYGNIPWAAPATLLKIAYDMAMNLPEDAKILECGTGISTVILAATGRKVVALESKPQFAEITGKALEECKLDAEILVDEIGPMWYSQKIIEAIQEFNADMILIDGPKREEKTDRSFPIAKGANYNFVKKGAALLWDDILSINDDLCEWVQCGTEIRPFVAGRLK